MAHIRYDKGGVASIPSSDPGWHDAAAQAGKRANERARRSDLTAIISETCGHGAPACFIPSLAEVHLNRTMVPLGRPERIDFTDRLWRLEHAAAVGALEHEAAHARHTRFLTDLEDVKRLGATRRMIDVITTLEEPRIEANALRSDSSALLFVKACALDIVMKDFHISDTPYGAAAAAGLLLARVDAGVLTKAEAAGFRRDIAKVLGEDTLDALQALWRRFLRLSDTDYVSMVQVAREWLEALDIDPEDDEDNEDDLAGMAMFGEPRDGDGEGEDGGEGEGKSLDDRIKERSRKVSSKVDEKITEHRGEERAERRRAERAADRARKAESTKPHDDAFGHGFSPDSSSHLLGKREPQPEERTAAKRLSKVLEALDYHDRVVVKTTTRVPPGRLRGRAAVAEAAAKADGRHYDGDLWTGKVRKVVDSTPLSIGLAVDISGSMGGAMNPLASTQWILSTAGAHVDAKVATVHFGSRIHGIMRAGQRERDVRVFAANDGSEAFKSAALALDAELNLINGRGARLLVVLSDGHFVDPTHAAYARTFVPLAIKRGVAVLWLHWEDFRTSYGATAIDCQGLSPTDVALLVGRAAAAEIKRLDSTG